MAKTFQRFIIESTLNQWNTTKDGYKIEINDSKLHDIVERIMNRTKLNVEDFNKRLKSGLSLIIHKCNTGKITSKNMVALEYLKSEFKILFLVNPEEKYIRISSVLDKDMFTKGAIRWNINEFRELFWDINESYLDNNHCVTFDDDTLSEGTTFMLEPNEALGEPEVFLEGKILEFTFDEDFASLVTEIKTNPADITWSKSPSKWVGEFEVMDTPFNIEINKYTYGKYSIWGYKFYRDKSAKLVNDNKMQFKVYSTISNSIKEFITSVKPEVFVYQSDANEPSRVKLYTTEMVSMAKQYRYADYSTQEGSTVIFALYSEDIDYKDVEKDVIQGKYK